MQETESVKMIRGIRRKLLEEEQRVGREEYRRRRRKRVEEFLQGTLAEFVPSRSAK